MEAEKALNEEQFYRETILSPKASRAADGPKALNRNYKSWHNPLSRGDLTLREVADSLKPIAVPQSSVPFIIQLIENPRYELPLIDLFPGATDLKTHDYVHILLGRGLLAKDEAFVIGFTMGSTDRMSSWRTDLFSFVARNFYPKNYRFSKEEAKIFREAVHLGDISDCQPLSEIKYEEYLDLPVREVRSRLGIEEELLRGYYAVEMKRYPKAKESQRLLL